MNHHSRSKLSNVLILALLLFGVSLLPLLREALQAVGHASEASSEKDLAEGQPLSSSLGFSYSMYMPLVFKDYGPRSSRLGYCSTTDHPITQYPDIRRLAAGWYVDFGVKRSPARPLGIEYVQTVTLHQVTECWPLRLRDRGQCPYVEPYAYTLTSPGSRESLVSVVQVNPGSLWLIGNEMDRYDWGGVNPYNPQIVSPSGGQDEMLPELYAEAYHELYHLIKATDPTAQVAIGGIIQATPARLEYLTKIWDEYQTLYGEDMPVDVWNVHNFIFKEACDDWGADIPPGCDLCGQHQDTGDPCYGTLYHAHPDGDATHASMEIFDQQIRAFRQWMKDHGQREKPLIVSEYGIVYHHAGLEDPELVRDFMLDTFEYFMTEKDCGLGYTADECRLVQRWAWYSLDDGYLSTGFNRYAPLIDRYSGEITYLGQAFAEYARNHLDTW